VLLSALPEPQPARSCSARPKASAVACDAEPFGQPDRLQAALAGSLRAARSGGRLPQTLGPVSPCSVLALCICLSRRRVESAGILVEGVVELQPDQPTQRQLAYAADLGISIPPEATKADLSDLISLKVDNDRPSTSRHRDFAKRFGISTTAYIGKRALFDRIQATLVAPGRETELLSWFTYRVYRQLVGGANDVSIQDPDHPVIQEIARALLGDEKVIKSIRRYEGNQLIRFGEWVSPTGTVHTGGSNRTAAYQAVSSLLKGKVSPSERSINPRRSTPSIATRRTEMKAASKGCLSVLVVAFLIPLGVAVCVSWL
jgi:hypothetical protein